jgi:serine/threonine protein kinase/Tfp pilus assembly protein PilF
MIGKTVSHYRIIEKIGEGGMGVVYKAEDTNLNRIVALKFLPRELDAHEPERVRFLQEARAASALNHASICTVHALGEHEGQQFIDMEFVDGVTLRAKIREAGMNIQEAVAYAIQIGEALQEAHAKGVVHRDVKPENIMVNTKDQIKVMDFGLAKLKGSLKLTRTSSTVGTLAYMAPEQIEGREVDARSDIFSFGIVLYEMLTGHRPFRGDQEGTVINCILNDEPEAIQKCRPEVSSEAAHILSRALEKDPEDRYQSTQEMLIDLKRARKETSRVSRQSLAGVTAEQPLPSAPKEPGAHFDVAAHAGERGLELPKQEKSIVVLPFENLSPDPDQEYFSDGLTEEIISDLSNVHILRVISRSSAMTFKGTKTTIPEIARRLNVQYVLEGSVRKAGSSLRITAQLIDARTDVHIWAEKYSGTLDDVFDIQEKVSRAIVAALKLNLAPEEKPRRPLNPEAHEAYLKGRFYWNKRTGSDAQRAIEYFNEAIEKDPTYALAYAGLASAYVLLPQYALVPATEAIPKAEAAANRALELDAALGEAHAVLGLVRSDFEWDWAGAEHEFKRAIDLDPTNPTARHWRALLLSHLGRLDEALAEIGRARDLDPLSLAISTVVGTILYYMRQYDEAIVQCKKAVDLDPGFPTAHSFLGAVYEAQGRFDEAIAELQEAKALAGSGPVGLADLGEGYARAGRRSEAARILNELLEFSRQGYSASCEIAQIYFGLGEKDKTFEWLEKAYQEKSSGLSYLGSDPGWDGLRSDPRFTTLLKKMGLAD